jgi:hypothetical protein
MLRLLLLTISIFQFAFLTTGCLKLDYEQVEVACNTNADCPFGNTCVANRCYPPEIAEIKEQEILDAQDSGSSDGNTDGTQVVDSGSSDGNTDGTQIVDSGSSDGNTDGTQIVDSGSSDGTQVVDSGSSGGTQVVDSGSSDGTQVVDSGSSDGTQVVDSGSSDGTQVVDSGSSDGTQVVDSGSSDGTQVVDSGIEEPSPCDDNPCQNGGTCITDDGAGADYTCECGTEYVGDNCEKILCPHMNEQGIVWSDSSGIVDNSDGSIIPCDSETDGYDDCGECTWPVSVSDFCKDEHGISHLCLANGLWSNTCFDINAANYDDASSAENTDACAYTFTVNVDTRCFTGYTLADGDKILIQGLDGDWTHDYKELLDEDNDGIYTGTFSLLQSDEETGAYEYHLVVGHWETNGDYWNAWHNTEWQYDNNVPDNVTDCAVMGDPNYVRNLDVTPGPPVTLDLVYNQCSLCEPDSDGDEVCDANYPNASATCNGVDVCPDDSAHSTAPCGDVTCSQETGQDIVWGIDNECVFPRTPTDACTDSEGIVRTCLQTGQWTNPGCRDENASNYNAEADADSGLCRYPLNFLLDLRCYDGNLADGATIALYGSFEATGWSEDSPVASLTDGDGDGLFFGVYNALPGDYQYKFAIDGYWANSEIFTSGDTCATDDSYYNRFVTVMADDAQLLELTYNSCDACVPDSDGDGVCDANYPNATDLGFCTGIDNCPAITNPNQADSNSDGIGNACTLCDSAADCHALAQCNSDGLCECHSPNIGDGIECTWVDPCIGNDGCGGDGTCVSSENGVEFNGFECECDLGYAGGSCGTQVTSWMYKLDAGSLTSVNGDGIIPMFTPEDTPFTFDFTVSQNAGDLEFQSTPTGLVEGDDGIFTYTPEQDDYTQTETHQILTPPEFTITATNSDGLISSIILRIEVVEVDDPATWTGQNTFTTEKATPVSGTVSAVDTADGMASPNYTVSSDLTDATVSIDTQTGVWTLILDSGFTGTLSFSISATDDISHVSTYSIIVSVYECGNGTVEEPETCDDADPDNYDECTEQCLSRFLGYGANTVTDNATGLVWQRCASGMTYYESYPVCITAAGDNGTMITACDFINNNDGFPACAGTPNSVKWCTPGDNCENDINTTNNLLEATSINNNSPALNRCADLNNGTTVGGDELTNWRLPSVAELKSLVYCPNDTPTAPKFMSACGTAPFTRAYINLDAFPNTLYETSKHTWTGQLKNDEKSFVVKFYNGGHAWGDHGETHFVRCVSGPALNVAADFGGNLSGTVDEGSSINGLISAIDINNGTLIAASSNSWEIGSVPSVGSATITLGGAWSYTASENAYNTASSDTFTVKFTDGNGFPETQTINIVINDVNNNTAPTATDVNATCVVGQSCTINTIASDPDPDTLSYMIVSQGVPGGTSDNRATIHNSSGVITYAPTGDAAWDPTYTIVYRVSDDNGAFGEATVTVTATAVGKSCSNPGECMEDYDCCNAGVGGNFCMATDGTAWQCNGNACAICTSGCGVCAGGGGP